MSECIKRVGARLGIDEKASEELFSEILKDSKNLDEILNLEKANINKLAEEQALKAVRKKNAKLDLYKTHMKAKEVIARFKDTKKGQGLNAYREEINNFVDRYSSREVLEKERLSVLLKDSLEQEGLNFDDVVQGKLDEAQISLFYSEISVSPEGRFRASADISPETKAEYSTAKALFKFQEKLKKLEIGAGKRISKSGTDLLPVTWVTEKIDTDRASGLFRQRLKEYIDFQRMGIGDIDSFLDKYEGYIYSTNPRETFSELDIAQFENVFIKPDQYHIAMSTYGKGGIMTALKENILRTAKTLTQYETLGTNPSNSYDKLFGKDGLIEKYIDNLEDTELRNSLQSAKARKARLELAEKRKVSIFPVSAKNKTLAKITNITRSISGATKLGQVVLSAFPDLATPAVTRNMFYSEKGIKSMITMGENLLSPLKKLIGVYGDDTARHVASSQRQALNSAFSSFLSDISENRLLNPVFDESVDNALAGKMDFRDLFSGKAVDYATNKLNRFSNALYKMTGADTWTSNRIADSYTDIAHDLGYIADKSFDSLSAFQKDVLRSMDINATSWNVLRKFSVEDNGVRYILPEAFDDIGQEDLTTLLKAGFIKQANKESASTALRSSFGLQSKRRVLQSSASARNIIVGDSQAGTLGGEFTRAFGQFSSFGVDLWANVVLPTVNKDGGKLTLGMAFGATFAYNLISDILKDFINNRQPALLVGEDDEKLATLGDMAVRSLGIPFMSVGENIVLPVLQGEKYKIASGVGKSVSGTSLGVLTGTAEVIGETTKVVTGEEELGATISRRALDTGRGIIRTSPVGIAIDSYLGGVIYEMFSPDYVDEMEAKREKYGIEPIIGE